MQDEYHPSYVEGPLSADLAREYTLHKILAASAFVFALCLLPVVQYVLVGNQASTENGVVAGVSTESPETETLNAVIPPNPTAEGQTDCLALKQQQLEDLARFAQGKKAAMHQEYQQTVQPYQDALAKLQGDAASVAEERAALSKLIDSEYTPYLNQVSAVEVAVAEREQAIQASTCGVEQ